MMHFLDVRAVYSHTLKAEMQGLQVQFCTQRYQKSSQLLTICSALMIHLTDKMFSATFWL